MVNSLSKTQLALINILAGNLIRSSRLILFSVFSHFGYGCCGTDCKPCVHSKEVVLRLRSSWALAETSDFFFFFLFSFCFLSKLEKNLYVGSDATGCPQMYNIKFLYCSQLTAFPVHFFFLLILFTVGASCWCGSLNWFPWGMILQSYVVYAETLVKVLGFKNVPYPA